MSLLSSMGIPPGDGLLGEIIEQDEAVRESMEPCPRCEGWGYITRNYWSHRVGAPSIVLQRYVHCPTCSSKHTVAGGAG